MDRKLIRRKNKKKLSLESAATATRIGFGDQMREFLRRNMNWFLVAGFALLLLQDVFGTHGVLAMRRTQLQAKEVQREIERLNNENRKLQNRVQHLKSDPATLEGIARDEMHLKRPGELVFPIPAKPAASGTPQSPDTQKNPQD